MVFKISLFYFLIFLLCSSNTTTIKPVTQPPIEFGLPSQNQNQCLELRKIVDKLSFLSECKNLDAVEKITYIDENNYRYAICFMIIDTFASACKSTNSSKTLPKIENVKMPIVCEALKKFYSKNTDDFFYKFLQDESKCSKLCIDRFNDDVFEPCLIATYMANLTHTEEIIETITEKTASEQTAPKPTNQKKIDPRLISNMHPSNLQPSNMQPSNLNSTFNTSVRNDKNDRHDGQPSDEFAQTSQKKSLSTTETNTSQDTSVKKVISQQEDINKQPNLVQNQTVGVEKPEKKEKEIADLLDANAVPTTKTKSDTAGNNQPENVPAPPDLQDNDSDLFQKLSDPSPSPPGDELNPISIEESADPLDEEFEEDKTKPEEKPKPLETYEDNIGYSASYPNVEEDDSYFFSYFMLVCIIFILGYVGYHNKQKILALVLEGRRGKRENRRRPNSANYHKLDCNLEEAVTSSCNKNTTNVIY